jgi:hypothetical protein
VRESERTIKRKSQHNNIQPRKNQTIDKVRDKGKSVERVRNNAKVKIHKEINFWQP